MARPKKILLQTTIPFREDDWHVARFSMLRDHLASTSGANGEPLFDVTPRDRAPGTGNDPVLSTLDTTDFDQIWIFAVDEGDGLTEDDCAGITRFRQRGGGILATRDHNDLGCSLCTLGGVGAAHYFHSHNPDPDESRRCRDDDVTLNIDFPNYHSGANGDPQTITPVGEIHPLLRRPDGSPIEFFPAHPHEGAVGVPPGSASARAIAKGSSLKTGRDFDLIVAFEHETDEHGNRLGRAIAESSFHHLADYNWDPRRGCPTFVEEAPGDGYLQDPAKLDDIKAYVANAAAWLS